MADGFADRLAAAGEACRLRLEEKQFADVLSALGSYRQPDSAFRLLSEVAFCPGRSEAVERLRTSIPNLRQNLLEQTLLILAAQYAIGTVPDLAVADSVKRLFAGEFQFFANPPPAWMPHLRVDDLRYREMARLATLQRFPAGQLEWQIGEFRRSWVLAARRPWRAAFDVIRRLGCLAPLFDLHINPRRKNRLILLERETNLSYYRVARSLEKQPGVRGVMLRSWLFCESTARVTPRLAWLRQTPLSAGALIVDTGEAPPVTGYLTGSEERRKLYVTGAYLPTMACVLWPRRALIAWADRHPEFDT